MITFWPIAGSALIVALGILATWRPETVRGPMRRLRARPGVARVGSLLREQRDHLARGFGSGVAFTLIVCAAIPPIVAVLFALGMLVTHQPVWGADVALYRWFESHGPRADTLLRFMHDVSRLGEWPVVLKVSGVAALGLFVLAPRRRWLGPLLVGVALILERDVQAAISLFVHQVQPPTTEAGFPSGGVARVVCVYGFIVFLALRLRSRPRWRTTALAWAGVALFAFLMGYARAALLLHWPFDIPAGWVLGTLLLATLIGATSALDRARRPERADADGDGRAEEAGWHRVASTRSPASP
jgi:membrane-associated phospholipid phosphatase